MPVYPFICDGCGSTNSAYFPIQEGPSPFPHEGCGTFLRRWTVPALKTPFQAGFNHSVGRVVHSEKDFKSALAEGSEAASLRDGQDHSYTVVEAPEQVKVDETGMEATHREHRRLGLTQPKRTIVT